MKLISNWQNATVFDMELDGLLRECTKIHVLSFQMQGKGIKSINGEDTDRLKAFFQYHVDNKIPLVAHNGTSYDIPAAEKVLGIDLSEILLIDSLNLSWYLNFDRKSHGLASFLDDYGVEKPEIDDWENLTYEEYKHRCSEDVRINKLLWEDFKERLTEMYSLSKEAIDSGELGGTRSNHNEEIHLDSKLGMAVEDWISEILTFLNFKSDCIRLQEKTGWDLDEELLDKSIQELEGKLEEAKAALESVMPKAPKYAPRTKPKKLYLRNGELSETGKRWAKIVENWESKAVDEDGNPLVKESNKPDEFKILNSYEPPNANSTAQVKRFLFSGAIKLEYRDLYSNIFWRDE